MTSKYDPIEFWNNREHPNSSGRDEWQPFRYNLHANYIKKHIKGCESILDFGSGKGGFFRIYDKEGIKKVYTYDISESFKEDIIDHGKKFNFEHIHIIDKVLVPSLKFKVDAIICCNSLQHTKPENIVDVIRELKKAGKKIIALESYNPSKKYNECIHYCSHNYFEICKENKWKIIDEDYQEQYKQLHFVIG